MANSRLTEMNLCRGSQTGITVARWCLGIKNWNIHNLLLRNWAPGAPWRNIACCCDACFSIISTQQVIKQAANFLWLYSRQEFFFDQETIWKQGDLATRIFQANLHNTGKSLCVVGYFPHWWMKPSISNAEPLRTPLTSKSSRRASERLCLELTLRNFLSGRSCRIFSARRSITVVVAGQVPRFHDSESFSWMYR